MTRDMQRLIVGLPTLGLSFGMIILDGAGLIDVSKMGYAAIGGWITFIITFYFRKSGTQPPGGAA